MNQLEILYFNEALVELGVEYDHDDGEILWVRILQPSTVTEGDRDRVARAILQWLPTSNLRHRFKGVGIQS